MEKLDSGKKTRQYISEAARAKNSYNNRMPIGGMHISCIMSFHLALRLMTSNDLEWLFKVRPICKLFHGHCKWCVMCRECQFR